MSIDPDEIAKKSARLQPHGGTLWASQLMGEMRLVPCLDDLKGDRDLAIEGLRGLCAVLVIVTHMSAWETPIDSSPLVAMFSNTYGVAAVFIFFVISGYVIGVATKVPPTKSNIRSYTARRLVRIVPIAWFSIVLSILLVPVPPLQAAAHFLFLENGNPYPFGIRIPVLQNDIALWSLPYEVFFYFVFIGIWKWTPRLRTTIVVTAGAAAASAIGFPRIFSSFAYYFSFWLAGLCVAWLTKPPGRENKGGWVCAIAGAFAYWTLAPLQTLAGWYAPVWMGTAYCRFDFIIPAISVVLAVTRRASRVQEFCASICSLAGIGILAARFFGGEFISKGELLAGVVLGVCFIFRRWRPEPRVLLYLAPLGAISYALYAIHSPVLGFVRGSGFFPVSGAGELLLKICLFFLICTAIAWLLEAKFQPWFRRLKVIRALSATP
jgi:peptidoglycan/LPS O-acetylase OafA/YrhL